MCPLLILDQGAGAPHEAEKGVHYSPFYAEIQPTGETQKCKALIPLLLPSQRPIRYHM